MQNEVEIALLFLDHLAGVHFEVVVLIQVLLKMPEKTKRKHESVAGLKGRFGLLSVLRELLDAVMNVEHLTLLQAETIMLFLIEMAITS